MPQWQAEYMRTNGSGLLQIADDLGQGRQVVLRGDEVRQAKSLVPRQEIRTDLLRAADEGRRHLPYRLDVDPGPAALDDQVLCLGAALVSNDERAERVDLKVPEPFPGGLADHADLRVERRGQPVPGVVAVRGVPDRGRQHA